jgi:hypothetical protein
MRIRPFFEPSSHQGDGENPYKHSHCNTISFPSYLSNVAPFNPNFEFLELMELMHPFLLQWNLYAADAASAASRALHKNGTMPGNSAHVAESFLRTSASFLNRDILIQPRMVPYPTFSRTQRNFRAGECREIECAAGLRA